MAEALPVSAVRVLGVIWGPLPLTMAKKAAVPGDGGGNPLALPRGVSPVLKLERSGVKPVRNEDGSKG